MNSLEIRCIEEFTHKLENDLNLRIIAYQVAATYKADVKHTHLTVKSNVNVSNHQGEYYIEKSG